MTFRHRRWATGLVLTLAAATLSGCGKAADDPLAPAPVLTLTGQWERFNSSFPTLNGMVVAVNSAQTQATIAEMQANPYGFIPGDLKWRNIIRVQEGEYTFDDLVRETNGNQSYVTGRIVLLSDNQELAISFPNTTGTFQQWRRKP